MGLRFKEQEYGDCFFVTTSFHQSKSFGNIEGVYDILAESLNFRLQKTNSVLPAYVLMPSHIHLLLLLDGKHLASFMRDFKKYTSQKHLISLCESNSVWQPRYNRQAVWSMDVLRTKINYIHNNPVKAGLVDSPDKWRYSSAPSYLLGDSGPVNVFTEWY